MPRFDKHNAEELKVFLYNSYVHDAKLENIGYECGEDILKIKLFNPIFDVKIDLTFYNVGLVLAIKGTEYGSHETLISLTMEEDFSYLQAYLTKYSKCIEGSIYLLFQMLSGDEFHVVSKEVIVDITR